MRYSGVRAVMRVLARSSLWVAVRRELERFRTPAVSVIMPVYNVEAYVGECLDSVLAQDFTSFELIAVDDGSTDGSAAVLQRYASRDHRVRVMRQDNAGQGVARNRAIESARGQFLVFVDSDDIVPPGSFRFLMAALRRSGSDFAVAGVRRLDAGRRFRPSWTVAMLEHDRVGITIDDFPGAMADVVAHHRIFSRSFWLERIGGFPAGAYEDHAPMVAAYLRAGRFDLLTRVVYEWRLREDGTSTGQQKHALENLEQRLSVKAHARRLVEMEASSAARAAWVGRVLDIDLPPYIDHALRGDKTYRDVLSGAFSIHGGLATEEALSYVRVQQKVRTWLAARGSWNELETAQRHFRELGSIPPTVVQSGRVLLADRRVGGIQKPVPVERAELGRTESRLQVCALRAEWLGPGRLRLTGWAVIRGIDLTSREPEISMRLEAADGSGARGLPVERALLPEASRWVSWAHGAFDRAGFRTTIDLSDLLGDADAPRDWRLHVRVEVEGVVREGRLHHAVAGSSASRAAISPEPRSGDRRLLVPWYDGEHGLTLSLRHPREVARPTRKPGLEVAHVEVLADALVVRGRANIRIGRRLRMSCGDVDVEGVVQQAHRGGVAVTFPLRLMEAGQVLPSGTWVVRSPKSTRPAVLSGVLAQTLPIETVTATHRVRVAVGREFELQVELGPPLRDNELGARAQRLLQEAYATSDPPARPGILLIPGPERTQRDLPSALAEAAARAGVPCRWSVPDLATAVPSGAEPSIIGSRPWYEHLAATSVLVSERDLEPWFRKGPHQRMVRVFPAALDAPVGRAAWWGAGYTPGRIADELARVAMWDVIVGPAPSAEGRYRHELGYAGPVITSDMLTEWLLAELSVAPRTA